MTKYNLVIEINEEELLADYGIVGNDSTDISLLIQSTLTPNRFPGLTRILEISQVKFPTYTDVFREVSTAYLTCEIPDGFFVFSEKQQYRFLEDNTSERYEFSPGEYLFREIDKETHWKFLLVAERPPEPEAPLEPDLPCECGQCAEEEKYFECPGCLRSTIPYCQGGSDELSDYCTPCWHEITSDKYTVVIQKGQLNAYVNS